MVKVPMSYEITAEQEHWSLIVDLTGLVSPTSPPPLPIVLEKKWTIYLFLFCEHFGKLFIEFVVLLTKIRPKKY